MAIIFKNDDKLTRAKTKVREKGGDVDDEDEVLYEYLRLGGAALDEQGKIIDYQQVFQPDNELLKKITTKKAGKKLMSAEPVKPVEPDEPAPAVRGRGRR